ncbi:MAG: hypothetical protein KC912_23465 [Proteobacteria bacterium]|nr:hypothetical protein [Pseudomonadota bacterium]
MRCVTLLSILTLSSACNPSSSIDGTWVLQLDMPTRSSTSSITENFVNGQQPTASASTGPTWIYDSEETGQIATVRIIGGAGKTAFASYGDKVLPGVREGGVWVFTLEQTDSDSQTLNDQGYTYLSAEDSTSLTRILFTPGGKEASGQITQSTTRTREWAESDQAAGYTYMRIPADDYLEPIDPNIGYYVENEWDTRECDDTLCRLTVGETSSAQQTFVAQWTELGPEDSLEVATAPSAPPQYYDTGWY